MRTVKARDNTIEGKTHSRAPTLEPLRPGSDQQSLDLSPFNIARNGIRKDIGEGFPVFAVHTTIVSKYSIKSKGAAPKPFRIFYREGGFLFGFLEVAGRLSFFFTVELAAKVTIF